MRDISCLVYVCCGLRCHGRVVAKQFERTCLRQPCTMMQTLAVPTANQIRVGSAFVKTHEQRCRRRHQNVSNSHTCQQHMRTTTKSSTRSMPSVTQHMCDDDEIFRTDESHILHDIQYWNPILDSSMGFQYWNPIMEFNIGVQY